MRKRLVILLALLPLMVVAQDLRPLRVDLQDNVKLPWGLSNLSVVDGQLHALSGDVAVRAHRRNSYVYALIPDTLVGTIGEPFSYVVRNPRDSHLYYSRVNDDNGRIALYEHVKDRGRRNRQVELRTWFREILHPTFSPDGNMLVFSAKGKVGLGGYDLWCSFWNGKRWSKPLNLGGVINTTGDEVCPVFYGHYLIYASNDTADSAAPFYFHSVRMPRGASTENILFDQFQVQTLPSPLNSGAGDKELAIDTIGNCGYWVSRRGGEEALYSFQGCLAGVLLRGTVASTQGAPIMGAEVRVLVGNRLVTSIITDSLGRYQLFVQPGSYQLEASCPNYFISRQEVMAMRVNENNLVYEFPCDIAMSSLPFGETVEYANFYRQGADVEISAEGQASIKPLVDFLRDNPQVHLRMAVFCDQTTDSVVNNMIIERRISYLYDYFASVLPNKGQILIKNGNEMQKNEATGSGDNKIFTMLIK